MRIPSGVTDQYIYFVAVDATDLKTRETGLTSFTVYRSRNGGAAAAMTTPTVNETDATNMPGVYELLLDEDMTIDAGDDSQEMAFHITQASMAPVTRTIELYRPKITAGNTLTVASDGDLTEVNTLTGHTAQTGDNFARIGAPAGASIAADIAVIEGQTDDIGVAGAGLTGVPWNAAWDAEVESEVNDALIAQNLDHLVKSAVDTDFATTVHLDSVIGQLSDNGTTATFDRTTDSLEALQAEHDSTQSKVDTVDDFLDTEIAAIKAKTDNLPASPAATSDIPSAATIADAVLDEDMTAHQTQGTLGQAIGDPVADTDTIFGLVNTNLDAAISSRASQTSLDTVDDFLDTEISAIKTATDLLNTAQAEPTTAPAANETPLEKLAYIFAALRNKMTVTGSAKTFYKDDLTSMWSKALSDDGTTYTEDEGA